MIEAYKRIEIAEVCYPYEAALWIALGRLPEALHGESDAEGRKDPHHLSQDYRPEGTEPFFLEELPSVDGVAGWMRYLNAKYQSPGASSVDEYFNGTGSEGDYDSRYKGIFPQGPKDEAGFIEASYVEELEAPVWAQIERARLKVLLALMEGRLPAWGLRLSEEHEPEEREAWDCARVEALPPSVWTNEPEVWSEEPEHIRSGFVAVWTDVQTLLDVFPTPDLPPTQVSGTRVGQTFIMSPTMQGAGMQAPRPTRGRPKAAAGAIETAVRNEFERRRKGGLLPEKREAATADCIEWVKEIFNSDIGRSTAQRYLRPVLDRNGP